MIHSNPNPMMNITSEQLAALVDEKNRTLKEINAQLLAAVEELVAAFGPGQPLLACRREALRMGRAAIALICK